MKLYTHTHKLLALAGIFAMGAVGLEAVEPPKFSGFVDTTYSYNFNKPASRRTAFRSFDARTDAFLLNAAQLNIEGNATEGVGYRVELAFGTDPEFYRPLGAAADATNGAQDATIHRFDAQEAYLTYKCSLTGLQLKAGKFVTYEGIEVIESKDNYNVTRGYLFGLAEPFTHVGAVLGYQFPAVVDVWFGAVNGWDRFADNNKGKTLIGKLGLNFGPMVAGSFSFTAGPEKTNVAADNLYSFDTTWFIKPVDMLELALQLNCGQEEKSGKDGGAAHWHGASFQPRVSFTDKISLASRYEWFSDLDGARTGVARGQILQTVALTPAVKLAESLLFRLEYRYDWSTRHVYEIETGALKNSHNNTVTTQLVYTF